MEKEKIRNLDEIIEEIENCNYIDCHEDEIYDDYQYENILYYLKQLKKQKEINQDAIDLINEATNNLTIDFYTKENDGICEQLLQILEDKEV